MSATTAERPEIAIPDPTDAPPRVGAVRAEKESRTSLTGESQPAAKRHGNLLVTVSAVALVAVAAGGVFYIGAHRSPAPHAAMTGVGLPMPHISNSTPAAIAPAAALARAPLPTHPAPLPAVPSDGGDDMSAFLKDGGHSAPGTVTPAVSVNPEASAPHPTSMDHAAVEPQQLAPAILPQHAASVPAETTKPAPAEVVATPAPAAAAPAPATVTATDAADIAARLTPGKMTDAEQIQVLDLVTKLGILVRNQDLRIAELQGAVSGMQGRVDTSLTDFGRRLALAEATGAVNGAAAAPASLPAVAATHSVEPATPVAARVVVHPRPVLASAADAATHRYHVQAASPGLAMLSELDASGGEEEQIPVSPGDVVPAYGKVISISQRGSAWVVKTQNGLIQ